MPIIELDQPQAPDIENTAFAADASPFATGLRGGANNCGAFSLQTFCSAGGLSHTHADAAGFLAYLEKFNPRNFWYQDAGVKVWAYYPTYDDWLDTYGMDAVKAAYHSGHGGMGADGTFYAPMGADWGGLGCTATSNKMQLGDQHARYVFWSTCLSLRVHDGLTPLKTWGGVTRGLRMIFGFDTVSWDSGDYGKNFWEEWNKGKSFSSAWLDASWRIAHDQGPSVMAFGATAAEAKDRVFNERLLSDAKASTAWAWWRWYDVAKTGRAAVRAVPAELSLAHLAPVSTMDAGDLAARFEFGAPAAIDGRMIAREGDRHLVRDADGTLTVRMQRPNLENLRAPSMAHARRTAEALINERGLDANVDLVFDRVLTASAAGGTNEGSGKMESARVTETLVQFRQVINGLPVLTPGRGIVRVALDNDGRATELHTSVREVDTLRTAPMGGMAPPEPGEPTGHGPLADAAPRDKALDAATSVQLRAVLAAGGTVAGVSTVPGTDEVGYDVAGNTARVVARKAIEVDFGNGYRKRYWVIAPLSA